MTANAATVTDTLQALAGLRIIRARAGWVVQRLLASGWTIGAWHPTYDKARAYRDAARAALGVPRA